MGRFYLEQKEKSRFYAPATFFGADEVMELLQSAGFGECRSVQTLFGKNLDEMKGGIRPGYGEGAFVAILCRKKEGKNLL